MEQIELVPRSRGYDSLPQQDRNPSPPTPSKSAQNQTPLRYSNGSSTFSLKHGDDMNPKDSSQKLLPKAYAQVSPGRRILRYIRDVAIVLTFLGVTLGGALGPVLSLSNPRIDASVTTYCSDLGLQDSANAYAGKPVSLSDILNINIAFGNLSFAIAKFIDLVWDILISRGGQALLLWTTFRVYSAILLWIMETERVSYKLFTTMSFSWATLWSLGPIIQTLFTKLKFRRKVLLSWMALSVIWVILWPTVTNAMTGYVAINKTLIKRQDNISYVDFSDVGKPPNFGFQNFDYSASSRNQSVASPVFLQSGPDVALWESLYNFWAKGGKSASSFHMSYVNDTLNVWPVYNFENETYFLDKLKRQENVQCIASGRYQWGFSIGATMWFLLINSLWAISTYVVWIITSQNSAFGRVRKLGKYRAALDLSEAILEDLGRDVCAYTDDELESELKKVKGIKYNIVEGERGASIGLSSRDEGPVRFRFGQVYGSRPEGNNF